MTTTAEMCSRPKSRKRLHDVYMTSGMLMGAVFAHVTGSGFVVAIIATLCALSWVRAFLAQDDQ